LIQATVPLMPCRPEGQKPAAPTQASAAAMASGPIPTRPASDWGHSEPLIAAPVFPSNISRFDEASESPRLRANLRLPEE